MLTAQAVRKGEKGAPEAEVRWQNRAEVAGGFALVAAQAARTRDALIDGRRLGSKKLSPLTRRGEKRSWHGLRRKTETWRQEVSEGLSAIATLRSTRTRGRMAR